MTLNEIISLLKEKTELLKKDNLEIEQAMQLYKECQELIQKGNEIIKKAEAEIEKVREEYKNIEK